MMNFVARINSFVIHSRKISCPRGNKASPKSTCQRGLKCAIPSKFRRADRGYLGRPTELHLLGLAGYCGPDTGKYWYELRSSTFELLVPSFTSSLLSICWDVMCHFERIIGTSYQNRDQNEYHHDLQSVVSIHTLQVITLDFVALKPHVIPHLAFGQVCQRLANLHAVQLVPAPKLGLKI